MNDETGDPYEVVTCDICGEDCCWNDTIPQLDGSYLCEQCYGELLTGRAESEAKDDSDDDSSSSVSSVSLEETSSEDP